MQVETPPAAIARSSATGPAAGNPASAVALSGTRPIVEMIGVNKWFAATQVLNDVSLNVAHRERIVICGPSGSGKSTLIRCINGLEPFQSGRIVVAGKELGPGRKRTKARSNVGMVFQSFNLFPHLTVLKNCTLGPVWAKRMPRAE